MSAYTIHVTTAPETMNTYKCCLCKTSDSAGKCDWATRWDYLRACVCLTARVFLRFIMSYSVRPVSNMFYQHVFSMIFSKFCGILCVFVNFVEFRSFT